MSRRLDLIGQTFGRLFVTDMVPEPPLIRGKRYSRCLCQCSCGTLLEIRASSLRAGNTKSCGCQKREMAAGHMKRIRFYEGLRRVNKLVDYIAYLKDADTMTAGLLYAHGWRWPQEMIKRGETLRAELHDLGITLTAPSQLPIPLNSFSPMKST